MDPSGRIAIIDNTLKQQYLKLKIHRLLKKMAKRKKHVKKLQRKFKRKEKKIAYLKSIILELDKIKSTKKRLSRRYLIRFIR